MATLLLTARNIKSAVKQNGRMASGSIGTMGQNQNPLALHKGCRNHVSVQDGFDPAVMIHINQVIFT